MNRAAGPAHGDIPSRAMLPTEAHPDQIGCHRTQGAGFGIESESLLLFQFCEKRFEFLGRIDEAVIATFGSLNRRSLRRGLDVPEQALLRGGLRLGGAGSDPFE